MSEQINIDWYEEHDEKDPIGNACCVVKNGKCQDLHWEDLFDAHQFDTLYCVTYVSSGSFFTKATSGFRNVQIIIGIEKETPRQAFMENIKRITKNEGERFFDSLKDTEKIRLVNSEIIVRYAITNSIIHSKFYLLSNSVTGSNRVIFGSANLTYSAFSNRVSQYEDIIVFDNDPIYEIYLKRFENLYQHTEDYVPRQVIENYKAGKVFSIDEYTPEEKVDSIINAIKESKITSLISDEFLQECQEDQNIQKANAADSQIALQIISTVTKKPKRDSDAMVMKSPAEIAAIKPKIQDLLYKTNASETLIDRFSLAYSDYDKKHYRIFTNSKDETAKRQPEEYGKQATTEEITQSVFNILKFVDAYSRFVSSSDICKTNLSRIFEAILYAFLAAYIFKLRDETSGNKIDIPIFLVIGGRGRSGKSYLLAYIDRILSGRVLSNDKHYIAYKDVKNQNTIDKLFATDNTYPLLIDEVESAFFNGKKGEERVKSLSNSLSGKHPVMICTTNLKDISMPSQVERRIYFLAVDSCFDETKKSECEKYYGDVMQEASNLLFRDFCFRMSERLRKGDTLFGENTADYLYCAREAFQEYFTIAGVEIPPYFPRTQFNDYDERGIRMWKTLFEQEQSNFDFKPAVNAQDAQLTIQLKKVVATAKFDKDAEVYMNYLRQDILVEESGSYVILRANPFFEWLNIDNPWIKKTFLGKIFKRKNRLSSQK